MVAIVQVREKNGAGETPTDKTAGAARFKMADNAVVDTNNPMQIPATGQNYSYEKWFRMFIGSTGPDTEITNLNFYMDGAKGWEATVKLWTRNVPAYATPGIPSTANDPPQIPVNGTPVAAQDAFGYTAGSPLLIGAGPFTAINTDMGDYVIMTMEVEPGSTQGNLPTEDATFEYDEL